MVLLRIEEEPPSIEYLWLRPADRRQVPGDVSGYTTAGMTCLFAGHHHRFTGLVFGALTLRRYERDASLSILTARL